ncbi:PREDICTED: actin cytoskeleton-regulatory complex protein PAN1-like [Priapulus caudatus]|uniref:Actin cytoskeleton-regulatory complex protein PAN1-like n=1 Tax=Priapulus caudatus TaxID=37621 RepID=A0ABM1EW03_PRICU|nr:PREDICTED: actin cytoskeleton-regulatory complex protein PAN1-like [Priapulus caudatus]
MATAPDTQTQVNRRSSRRRGSNPRQPKEETQRRRATHLEFTQAMDDFKTMFPDVEEDVIETVLRANKGAVDTTIDHLLALSVDIDGESSPRDPRSHAQTVVFPGETGENRPQNASQASPGSGDGGSLDTSALLPKDEPPPPPYSCSPGQAAPRSPDEGAASEGTARPASSVYTYGRDDDPSDNDEGTTPTTTTAATRPSGAPVATTAAAESLPSQVFEPTSSDDEAPPAYTPRYDRTWAESIKPKQVAEPNLMSFKEDQQRAPATAATTQSPMSPMQSLAMYIAVTPTTQPSPPLSKKSPNGGARPLPAPPGGGTPSPAAAADSSPYMDMSPGGAGIPRQETVAPPLVPPRTGSAALPARASVRAAAVAGPHRAGAASAAPPSVCICVQSITAADFSTAMLKRQIQENQRRMAQAQQEDDLEMQQMLEDERVALMMQNQEFLRELRRNEEFMNQLEGSTAADSGRSRSSRRSFKPPPPSSDSPRTLGSAPCPPHTSSTIPSSHSVNVSASVGPDGQMSMDRATENDHVSGYLISDQLEPKVEILFNHDTVTDDGVSAFPYGMPLQRDEEAEFREKLRYMDNPTRRMFMRMARLFSNGKKKKTARQMLEAAPSTVNLLEEEEDEEESRDAEDQSDREGDNIDNSHIIEPLMGFRSPSTAQRPT